MGTRATFVHSLALIIPPLIGFHCIFLSAYKKARQAPKRTRRRRRLPGNISIIIIHRQELWKWNRILFFPSAARSSIVLRHPVIMHDKYELKTQVWAGMKVCERGKDPHCCVCVCARVCLCMYVRMWLAIYTGGPEKRGTVHWFLG